MTAIRLKQAILRTVVEVLGLIPVVTYLVGSVLIIIHVTRTKYMIMLATHCKLTYERWNPMLPKQHYDHVLHGNLCTLLDHSRVAILLGIYIKDREDGSESHYVSLSLNPMTSLRFSHAIGFDYIEIDFVFSLLRNVL